MNKTQTRKPVNMNVVVATAGVALAAASFAVGFKSGFKLKSMTMDLQAHQLILMKMRETNPELIDAAVRETVSTAEALYAAAN